VTTDAATGSRKRIVVAGGGAGGLELVRRLGARYGRHGHDVILIERERTHIWKPLLHEVAAGSLDANLDELGYLSHCHRWGYRYLHGSLEWIDTDNRKAVIAPLLDDEGEEVLGRHYVDYDYLVVAIGSVSNDFGVPGVAGHCIPLENRAQADRFRRKLFNRCLRVSRRMATDPSRDEYVRVAIVGGGATGVELAAELFNAASALKYFGLEVFDENRLKVTLLEAGPRILPALPENLAAAAREELENLGVRVLTSMMVTEVTRDAVVTGDGEEIESDLKVWAAGVRGPDVLKDIGGLETTRSNQLVVKPTLQTTRDERIFAVGDCCYFKEPGAERPIPPRAQAAHQMASTVYDNLRRLMEDKPLREFEYRDHGSLVSLSRFSTVGSLMGNLVGGNMAVEGRLARMVYVSLYRMHLLAIHGWLRGIVFIVMARFNNIVRPKLKLH
jgi:NADH dehydrogenase